MVMITIIPSTDNLKRVSKSTQTINIMLGCDWDVNSKSDWGVYTAYMSGLLFGNMILAHRNIGPTAHPS